MLRPQPKKKPWRSAAYLSHVREQPCAVPGCKVQQIEAHHVKAGGVGTKCSDSEVVPLCGPFGHHAELHQIGKKTFEQKYKLDLILLALQHFESYNQASNVCS